MRQTRVLKQTLCEVPAWEQFLSTIINLHDSLFNRASAIDDGSKHVRAYGKSNNMKNHLFMVFNPGS